jgi:hypothetical protein
MELGQEMQSFRGVEVGGVTTGERSKTLLLKNSLGWRLYTWKHGHKIVGPNPLWRRGLVTLGPVILLVAIGYFQFWQNYGHLPPYCPWQLVVPPLLVGLWFAKTTKFYLDRDKGIIKTWDLRLPFGCFTPSVYRTKKGRYILYVHDIRPRSSGVSPACTAWKSTDRSEVTRVLMEAFGASITRTGPDTFRHVQRPIWDEPSA